jgi:aminoglycoside phosphotransferase (APT) family kinase protein
MAQLQHSLHSARHEAPLRTFREWTLASLRALREQGAPADVLDYVEDVVMALPAGGVLCHGDLHPGNILMTAAGPQIIDWVSALNANPLVDVAREHLTLTVLPLGWDALRREADAAFIDTYAALAGTTSDDLLTAIAPYMAVMAAMRMMESHATDDERRMLADYIRSMRA